MKTFAALTTASAALTTSLVAGAIYFAPTPATASFAPAGAPSQIAVNVHDDEGDPLKKVEVLVTDANTSGRGQVDAQRSGDDGHLQVSFPSSGTYIVHIDTPPDTREYNEGDDTDSGATFSCGGKVATRCITVNVSNGVAHFPGTTSASPANDLTMWFVDRSPEPRIEAVVELKDSNGTLVQGGTIDVKPVRDDPAHTDDDPFSMHGTGRTLSEVIRYTTYRVTFTPPAGYTLADPARRTRTINVGRRTEVRYVVIRANQHSVGETGSAPGEVRSAPALETTGFPVDELISPKDHTPKTVTEPAPAPTPTGPTAEPTTAMPTTAMPDRVVTEPTPDGAVPSESSPDSPVPTDTVPSETVPSDTVPSETVPSDIVPSETVPPASNPNDGALTAECLALLELYPSVVDLDTGLFNLCEVDPAAAITLISELLAEIG